MKYLDGNEWYLSQKSSSNKVVMKNKNIDLKVSWYWPNVKLKEASEIARFTSRPDVII